MMRRGRIVLRAVAVLTALFAAYRICLWSVLQAEVRKVRAAGYPTSCAEYNHWRVPEPESHNAADLYLQLTNHVYKISDEYSNVLPVAGRAKLMGRSEAIPPEQLEAIREYLAVNHAALALILQASVISYVRNPIDSDMTRDWFWRGGRYTNSLRAGARIMFLEALYQAEKKESRQSVAAICASMNIARLLRDRPDLIDYFSDGALVQMSLFSLEHALSRTSFTDDQLSAVAQCMEQIREDQFYLTLIGELVLNRAVWDQFRSGEGHPCDLRHRPAGKRDVSARIPVSVYRFMGILDWGDWSHLKFSQEILQAVAVPLPACLTEVDRVVEKHNASLIRYPLHSKGEIMSKATRIHAAYVARKRTALVGLEIERYRNRHGRLPEDASSTELSWRADPFTGEPLRYRRLDCGYVVYSVGNDLVDDGGDKMRDVCFVVER
jgi:hypothetical protein